MKNILFKKFSMRIIIQVSPESFNFHCSYNNSNFSLKTFAYIDNSKIKSSLLTLGEEIPKNLIAPDMYRINIFDIETPLPPKTTLEREDLYQVIFGYGIGKCFEDTILPILRPIVFILGADKFKDRIQNPKITFENAAKRGGAGMIIFDKTDL